MHNLYSSITRMYRIRKEVTKIYLTYYNLLIAEDLWQARYQILWIIFFEGIYKIKCKYWHDYKKCGTCKITQFKDNIIGSNVDVVTKYISKTLMKKIKERFFNTFKFSNH